MSPSGRLRGKKLKQRLKDDPHRVCFRLCDAFDVLRKWGFNPEVDLKRALASGMVEFRGKHTVLPDGTRTWTDVKVNVGGLVDWMTKELGNEH